MERAKGCSWDDVTPDDIMMLELVRGFRDPILRERLLQVKNPTIDGLIGIANSWPLTLDGQGILDTGGACTQQEVPSVTIGGCRAGEAEVTAAKDAQESDVQTPGAA